MSEEPFVWSHSRLYTYDQCGEKYRRRYEERDRRPKTLPQARGTAFANVVRVTHGGQVTRKARADFADALAEVGFRAAVNEGLPDIEELKALAADSFTNLVAEGVTVSKQEEEQHGSYNGAVFWNKDFTIDASGAYRRDVAPRRNPIGVERHIKANIRSLRIQGYVDVIECPGEEDGEPDEIVRDQKIGRRPRGDVADISLQLTTYALLRWAETRRIPAVSLDYMTERSDSTIELIERNSTREPRDLTAIVERFRRATVGIEAGVFIPTNPANWWCSQRWCEYWNDCPFVAQWRGARKET